MKKIVLFVLLTAAAGGMLFAQTTRAAATINGTLGLSAGRIVVKNETATYYTRGLDRLVGFIDGFKDGAQVTMEGYVSAPSFGGETEKLFFPVKLTLNGKTYDVGPAMTANGMPCYSMGYGRNGRGFHGRGR